MKNSLYPFFWQHGEEHQVLETYMEKISESGMGGVCIEARPHPEFVKEGWWSDLDCIIKKAKELSMKLWILDDSHFPTGYANGKVKEAYPQYLKLYLDMRRYDIHGPLKKARIDLSLLKGRPWDKPDFSEEIVGVYMAKRTSPWQSEGDQIDIDSMIDVTECINPKTRLLTVDVKEGAYSIFVVYETRKGGEDATKDYLNPLVKEATQVLIDEVYEPHYKYYKEEFGKDVQVLLLQNHGIFVAANTVEEIGVLFDGVISTLEKQVKRTADVSDAVTPEKEAAAQKLSQLLGHAVEVVPAAEADNFVKNKEAAAPLLKPFTPDHIVYCGPYPLFIENIDQAKEALDAFMTENDKEPRLILVQGVGAFIMEDDKGNAAKAQLLAKDAIKLAVYAESFGGPLQMTDEITYFITHWEAEAYRSKK